MYEEVSRIAISHGFGSHNGGRCGLHVHVNRNFFGKSADVQNIAGYKMMRLLQRFERQFTVFARRENNRWCSYHTGYDYTPNKDVKVSVKTDGTTRCIGDAGIVRKAKQMSYETDHSQALNFQHGSTFEFRIFRGTFKWSTYYACLALVNGMCHLVKNHGSEYVESVDWYTLMSDVILACDEPLAAKYLGCYLQEKGLIAA